MKENTLLAIETSTQVCGVALLRGEVLLAEQRTHIRNIHARQLLQSVETLLHSSGTELDDLDAIAVSIGPGSFTGLRIGLSFAKGVAIPRNLPLIPVPTFSALASQAPLSSGLICTLFKAKADEYFAALYKKENNNIQLLENVMIIKQQELETFLPSPALLIGHVSEFSNSDKWQKTPNAMNLPSAYACGLLAGKIWRESELPNPDTLEPAYYQDFIAGKPKNVLDI